MITWKLKNKTTGNFYKKNFTSRQAARDAKTFKFGLANYTVVKGTLSNTASKTKATTTKGTTATMNTKPQLKKIKFGTPVHKAKPVHRSY